MDLLTVKEVAELKGCSLQYIQRIIKSGKLQATHNENPTNHIKEYAVPASALPVDLQRKYYGQRKAEVGLPPELKPVKIEKKSSSKAVKKAFEEYTAEEREEIALWCKILKDW
ncbi:MAG TPA: MerR family transcriptional regulator, partial [Oscillospiraceae bacterium]|nr:MerR family transcriptional regulator [Oscillospiraceae bacterium]